MAKILVVDDEESLRFTFEHFLTEAGYEVACASTYNEALSCVSEIQWDAIFLDIILDGKTGVDFLRECGGQPPTCPVIMITGYPSIETAAHAVRLGAFDYIPKPVEPETLLQITDRALRHKRAADEREEYRSRLAAVFGSVDESIVTVDRHLCVTETNEAARRICGFDRDAIGKDMKSLISGCREKCLEALAETLAKRQPVRARHVECRRTQTPKIVDLSTYPLIDGRGLFTGAVLVCKDETRAANLECNLSERQRLHKIVGKSRPMKKTYALIRALADVETTVLITGESGTGKELVAEALHQLGPRRDKPLVKVNCSTLSEALLASELFGHVKGAFTGAISETIGRFQRADGGTIFLDEIGDLSPRVQVALLRVLQERKFERVGDSTPIKVDVRVIAATNKDLQEKVRLSEFRADLLYRLRVVEIGLPPLRERREDIPLLVQHFLKQLNRKIHMDVEAISSDVARIFFDYSWPGNVRELENVLEHAFVVCNQKIITVDHLPPYMKENSLGRVCSAAGTQDAKPQAIVAALEKTAGNKAKAARLLGIDRKTLYRKIGKYGIPGPTAE